MVIQLPTRRKTIVLARALGPLLRPSDLLILMGDLGAGKTFFTRALLRSRGVGHATPVTSPTFTLVQEYEVDGGTWMHVDAYRVADEGELAALGLREARAEGNVLIVEWGEPHLGALGGDALIVRFLLDLKGRSAVVSSTGARSAEIERALTSVLTDRVDQRPRRGVV